MDNNRITQILQEIINSESSKLSRLNEYLQEAITNASTWYSTEEYKSLQNELSESTDRNSELESQIKNLREQYEKLIQELNDENADDVKTNAELEALRMLSDSIRNDRDNLQSIISYKDLYIEDLKVQISSSKEELEISKSLVIELQNKIAELNSKISGLLAEISDKQNQILILSDTTDEVKAALEIAKSKIKTEMEEAMSEIDEALDNINSENVSSKVDLVSNSVLTDKNGPYSDGFYKNGVIDTTFSTPFTSIKSGPDTFEATDPLLALDDNLYYSYTNGIAKPYGSQIIFFLPDGTPQTMDGGNWGSNYVPQTPNPMQANNGLWYTLPGGTPILVVDSKIPVAIQQIGPRAGSYDVYYTFENGFGTVAEGTYSTGSYVNGVIDTEGVYDGSNYAKDNDVSYVYSKGMIIS
jgi:predicted  nucleic acid-binding Zn-ribbon protein